MNTITIQFDGGCQPNPGQKYGSYHILNSHGEKILGQQRVRLGFGTNNEAEFDTLEMALDDLLDDMDQNKVSPAKYHLAIITDSKIVRNRLLKNTIHKKPKWIEASTRMFNLAEKCLVHIRRFSGFKAIWKPRESNVAAFGH